MSRLWILATSMRNCWGRVKSTMALSCWVRCSRTTVGRPKPGRALMWRISSSIGTTGKPPVHKARRVLVGAQRESGWKSSLPERFAPFVPDAAIVRSPQPQGVCYMCVPRPHMKPCSNDDTNKRPQHFGKRIRHEQALREHFHRRYAGWEYDVHALMACTK